MLNTESETMSLKMCKQHEEYCEDCYKPLKKFEGYYLIIMSRDKTVCDDCYEENKEEYEKWRV